MGVSKGEEGGGDHPRKGVRFNPFCERGPCRVWRSGGFPKLSRKIFPLKLLPTLSHPFFSPSATFFNSFSPQTPPSNSLEQASINPIYHFSTFYLFRPLPTSLGPYQTPSRLLRAPSIGSQKGPF